MVDVDIVSKFPEMITLQQLKRLAKDGDETVAGMALLNRSRLSVTKVSEEEWNRVMEIVEDGGCPQIE